MPQRGLVTARSGHTPRHYFQHGNLDTTAGTFKERNELLQVQSSVTSSLSRGFNLDIWITNKEYLAWVLLCYLWPLQYQSLHGDTSTNMDSYTCGLDLQSEFKCIHLSNF